MGPFRRPVCSRCARRAESSLIAADCSIVVFGGGGSGTLDGVGVVELWEFGRDDLLDVSTLTTDTGAEGVCGGDNLTWVRSPPAMGLLRSAASLCPGVQRRGWALMCGFQLSSLP